MVLCDDDVTEPARRRENSELPRRRGALRGPSGSARMGLAYDDRRPRLARTRGPLRRDRRRAEHHQRGQRPAHLRVRRTARPAHTPGDRGAARLDRGSRRLRAAGARGRAAHRAARRGHRTFRRRAAGRGRHHHRHVANERDPRRRSAQPAHARPAGGDQPRSLARARTGGLLLRARSVVAERPTRSATICSASSSAAKGCSAS